MKKKLYVVTCADWVAMSEGVSPESAATSAFERAMAAKGEKMQITPIVDTICYSDLMEDHELEQYRENVTSMEILANAGFHDSARALKQIMDSNE